MERIFYIMLFTMCLAYVTGLRCYDCDPQNDKESCWDPKESNARVLDCNQDQNVCVASFQKYSENATITGVYRACDTLNKDVKDHCEFLKEQRPEIGLCRACTDDNCNYIKITENGKSAAPTIHTFLYVNLLAIIITLLSNE